MASASGGVADGTGTPGPSPSSPCLLSPLVLSPIHAVVPVTSAPILPSVDRYVRLNVGGALFQTTLGTLTQRDSMLRAMFSGRIPVARDNEGWILIDRSGRHFARILDYLRDGSIPLPDCRCEVEQIFREAQYYLLSELAAHCLAWLEANRKSVEELPNVCRVPIVQTKSDVEQMIARSHKPAIKLFLNRHNNKYSYTSNSDDNILKNLELFDRLVSKFHDRILFIKDIGSENSEVCQWKFFGKRSLQAEVCCTSIVYATDKKQTKVEFPDSKIYDEAMSILRFEHRGLCLKCGGEETCLPSSSAVSSWGGEGSSMRGSLTPGTPEDFLGQR